MSAIAQMVISNDMERIGVDITSRWTYAWCMFRVGGMPIRKYEARRLHYWLPATLVFLLALLTGVVALRAHGGSRPAGERAAHSLRPILVRPGSGLEPYAMNTEPNSGSRWLTRAIDKTQDTIFLEMYILTDRPIVRALERAAAEGVGVYVLLEPHAIGMGTQPMRIANELIAAGVNVRWTSSRFALTHAKFMVLDDSIAIVSTANFSHSAFIANREFLVTLTSKQRVRELSNIFRSDWDHVPFTLTDRDIVLSPLDARSMLTNLVRSARQSVDVYSEEIFDSRMEGALASASRRGVRVRIVLADGSSPTAVKRLAQSGVQIHQVRAPYIHAKAIIVDRREAFVGSENLSAQSLDSNREVGVLLRGEAVQQIRSVFEHDWLKGR